MKAPEFWGIVRRLKNKITDFGVWHFEDSNLIEVWYIDESNKWQTEYCRISDASAHEFITYYCGTYDSEDTHNWKEDGF